MTRHFFLVLLRTDYIGFLFLYRGQAQGLPLHRAHAVRPYFDFGQNAILCVMMPESADQTKAKNLPAERVGKAALQLAELQRQSLAAKENLAACDPNSESAQVAEIRTQVADKKN